MTAGPNAGALQQGDRTRTLGYQPGLDALRALAVETARTALGGTEHDFESPGLITVASQWS